MDKKEQKSNKKTGLIIGVLACIVLLLVGVVLFLLFGKHKETAKTSNEQSVQTKEHLSFNYMVLNKENLDLDESQKAVLEYFDNSYLYYDEEINSATSRYPSLFKNMKVVVYGEILEIVESNDETYTAIMEITDTEGHKIPGKDSFAYITGKQQKRRLAVKDFVTVYGTYETSVLQEYKGSNKNMAKINVSKWVVEQNKFDNDQLRAIAKTIFGENIKFSDITGCAYSPYCEGYPFDNGKVAGLKVKLEDPKNSNFTEFNIYKSGSIFEVGYCNEDNYMKKCDKGLPGIYLAADFKHFIVVTYETATQTAYLEYYDTEFNKIWRYELDKVNSKDSNYYGYLDYNENGIILVMDGYLNYINIKDGSKKFDPVLIGKDHYVYMLENEILLVGVDKKDYIEVVDYEGKIIKRNDFKSDIITSLLDSTIQIVGNEIVVVGYGKANEKTTQSYYGPVDYYSVYAKIYKLDSKLNVIDESDEILISE